jgi:methylaspartate mutase epsilon subunit
MTPKAVDLPETSRPLTFFTRDVLSAMRNRTAEGKLDFDADLLPIVELEMERLYYLAAIPEKNVRERLQQCGGDGPAMRRIIETCLREHRGLEPFNCGSVLDPAAAHCFGGGEEFASFVARYMEVEIERARRGHAGCALKAAVDIWYEVREELGSVLRFGGLTPESHRRLIEYHYPRFKRVVFGPPVINSEKLLALQRAHVLDFSVARNPAVRTDPLRGFVLESAEFHASVEAWVLVDARFPPTDMERDATPLYRSLMRRGMIRPFENRCGASRHRGYRPGAIDMIDGPNFVIDRSGRANPDIAVIGIPTEGNLVGNLTLSRDPCASTWAAEVMRQLHSRNLHDY